MLDNPELVRRLGGIGGNAKPAIGDSVSDNDTDGKATYDDMPRQFPLKTRSPGSSPPLRPLISSSSASTDSTIPIDSLVDNNVDTIFIKITELYSQEDYTIMYHTLLKIQNDAQYYMNYIDGLNKILEPVNIRIKKWIDDNIVF